MAGEQLGQRRPAAGCCQRMVVRQRPSCGSTNWTRSRAASPRSCAARGASCRSPCAGSRKCPRRSGAAGHRDTNARSRTPSSSRSRHGCGTPPPRPPCRSPGERLRHAGLEVGARGILQPRRLQRQQPGCLDLRGHVGELELDRLVLRDRLAERLALLRVAQRELQRALGDPAARGDVPARPPRARPSSERNPARGPSLRRPGCAPGGQQ